MDSLFHNDLLIQQLRSQIYQLKKSEEDYYLLQQQLSRLQTKYKLLSSQKLSNDREHQAKHQSYSRLIQQTKHQLIVLEDQLKYKEGDLREIDAQGLGLKRVCEEKNTEIERLRVERAMLLAQEDELSLEEDRLEQGVGRMGGEIGGLKGEYERVQNEYQHSFQRNKEHDKYLSDLVTEGKSFNQDIKLLEDRIMALESELHSSNQHTRSIQKQISDASSASKQLQIDISQVTSLNQKHKGEISHYIRLAQSEITRGNDIIRGIQGLQGSLKMIQQESEEVRVEIEELEKENKEVVEVNGRLERDTQNCEKHIEILGGMNGMLVGELDKLAEEDEVVRGMLGVGRKRGVGVGGIGLGSRVKGDSGSVKLSRTSHQSRF